MKKIGYLFLITILIVMTGCVQKEVASEQKAFITITQNNKEKILSEKEVTFEKGENLLEVMKENFNVSDDTGFVTEIKGVKADKTKKEAWFYQINGKDATFGAGDYKLKDKDKINWDLHSWE